MILIGFGKPTPGPTIHRALLLRSGSTQPLKQAMQVEYMCTFTPDLNNQISRLYSGYNKRITQRAIVSWHFARRTTPLKRNSTDTTDIAFSISIIRSDVSCIPSPLYNRMPVFDSDLHSEDWEYSLCTRHKLISSFYRVYRYLGCQMDGLEPSQIAEERRKTLPEVARLLGVRDVFFSLGIDMVLEERKADAPTWLRELMHYITLSDEESLSDEELRLSIHQFLWSQLTKEHS